MYLLYIYYKYIYYIYIYYKYIYIYILYILYIYIIYHNIYIISISIIYIYIYIQVERDEMAVTLVKTNYFSNQFSFGRDRSQGVCVRKLFVIPYAETENNGGERKVYVKWIQFRSWLRPSGAKISSFIIQRFSRCFSLSFNFSVDVVRVFLSCSIIIIFP